MSIYEVDGGYIVARYEDGRYYASVKKSLRQGGQMHTVFGPTPESIAGSTRIYRTRKAVEQAAYVWKRGEYRVVYIVNRHGIPWFQWTDESQQRLRTLIAPLEHTDAQEIAEYVGSIGGFIIRNENEALEALVKALLAVGCRWGQRPPTVDWSTRWEIHRGGYVPQAARFSSTTPGQFED